MALHKSLIQACALAPEEQNVYSFECLPVSASEKRKYDPKTDFRSCAEPMNISFSRYLAIVIGIVTPLAETIRRWSTWREDPPSLFDDYILGA